MIPFFSNNQIPARHVPGHAFGRRARRKPSGLTKLTALLSCTALLMQTLSGCGKAQAEPDACPYEEFLTVDVFDSLANFQGIQSGWFARIVRDRFNMELNIIAPNVAGGGDTLYEMRCAAGSLGDLIITTGEKGHLQELVASDLILDMSDYLQDTQIMRYDAAIRSLNSKLPGDGIYAIPSEISSFPADTPSDVLDPTFGPYVRWDLYAALGYPAIHTLEDLLPILADMQALYPETEDGTPTYAFSFFKDWDSNMMNAVKQPCCYYGYDEFGFVLAKADGSDFQDLTDPDSIYTRVLKFYFDANQLGLVDPDSSTQNYGDVFDKYANGSILYSCWPWQCQRAYNTAANMEEGRGFMLAPIDDLTIFSNCCLPYGNQKTVICIGSGTKDPERLAAFIDWLYSPEGIMINGAQVSNAAAGPQGLTWELDDSGNPVLTEFGRQAFNRQDTPVPEEWGGGTWAGGISELNYKAVSPAEFSPDGYSYYYQLWPSFQEPNATPLTLDWQAYTGSTDALSYLSAHDMLLPAPGVDYVAEEESNELFIIRCQCRSVITDYSWRMVFAEDEDAFYQYHEEMRARLQALDYDKIYAYDLAGAMAQDEARREVLSQTAP
ncbi:MAG: ABC transporter substrate-binding protein [bacterium]|nr:ABC transporter substrate-binding protein [bacterium]